MIRFKVELSEQWFALADQHARLRWPGERLPMHRLIAEALGRLVEPLGLDPSAMSLSVTTASRVHARGEPVVLDVKLRLDGDNEPILRGLFKRGVLPGVCKEAVELFFDLAFQEEGVQLVHFRAYVPNEVIREASSIGQSVRPPFEDAVVRTLWTAAQIGLPHMAPPPASADKRELN